MMKATCSSSYNNQNKPENNEKRTSEFKKCMEKCDQRDLKLREAEKTIANKDVIIKMLQNQVKKLEESCKQNLNQSEEFRYKYCLAAEKMKQLKSCTNNKCKGKQQNQQNQRDHCSNDGCKFNEQRAQSCAGNFFPQCLPEDSDQCNRIFIKNHYATLQLLVDEIVRKRYNLVPSGNNLPKEKQDENTGVSCSNCRNNVVSESQKECDGATIEDTKLDKKVSENTTSETCLQACLGSKTCNKTSSNEQSNVQNEEVNDNMRRVSSSSNQSGSLPRKRSLNENKLDEIEESNSEIMNEQKDTSDIDRKILEETSDRGFDSSQIEIDEVEFCQKIKENAKGTEETDVRNQSGSIVHAVDSFTIHHRHLSISASKQEAEDDQPYAFPQKTHDGRNLSRSVVSFHMVPVFYDESETKSKADDNLSNIEHEQQIHTQDLSVVNKDLEKQATVCSHSPNADSCKNNFSEIKNEITILAEKQETTYKELQEMRSQINATNTCTVTCNEEILNLKNIVEEQKKTFLANFEDNKIITDNLMNVTEKLSNELKEVKISIENLFKVVGESNKQRPTDFVNICCTTENKVPILNDSEIANKEILPCVPDEKDSCRILPPGETEDFCKLEDNYTELKKQKLQKDQQIKCLNNLISYYNKLNEEVLCLCPVLPTDSQEKSIDTYTSKSESECNYNDKTAPQTDKKNDGVNDTQKLECNCLPFYSQSENFSLCQGEDEFVYNENSEEIQIEDIYNSVLKCTKKSSSVYTPRSVKSLMCSCNLNFERSRKKMSIEDIYEAVRCSCKQRKEGRKDECVSSISSGCCMLHCDPHVVCDKSLHSNLEAYVNYLHEQLQVISTIENQIENLRVDIKSSS